MKIATNGMVFNELTQVLLMQRDDTRTWAPPGGSLDAGELPTEGVAREVREETGLIVWPVRLVGLDYIPAAPEGTLVFSFRCIQRGGEIQPSPESPRVGWLPTRPLPRRMLSFHRARVLEAFQHAGGPPRWQTRPRSLRHRLGWFLVQNVVYRYKDWQRVRRGQPIYQPPPGWRIGAFVVLRNDAGEVLWLRRTDRDVWNLPGGGSVDGEAPWQTAVRETREETGLTVRLTNLTGVYTYDGQNHLVCTFTAITAGGALTPGPEAAEFAYFAPGAEPPNAVPQHVERVADATSPGDVTRFKRQTLQ
ncbi:MAG: NUDIX domain-containing protein [Anaerolineales bacterium]|nr:NUDIX domain-containing protein [Anaerolineales bacterium]